MILITIRNSNSQSTLKKLLTLHKEPRICKIANPIARDLCLTAKLTYTKSVKLRQGFNGYTNIINTKN